MHQDMIAAKKMQQVQEHNDAVMARQQARMEQQRLNDIANRPTLLENARRVALYKVTREIPDYLLGEAFAEIYTNALPHERSYVTEHYNAFHKLAHMYIRKTGGMKHLAEQARVTGSPFLKGLYRAVAETSKEIIKDRTKAAAKAISEEEVKEMVSPKPSPDERAKLIKKIDKTLTKLDNDDYGYCDHCGSEIGIKRLEARPTADLCVDCKALAEIKEKQLEG
jgi:RNA polymerase-binding protein DksA